MDAVAYYHNVNGRRVTFEYLMLQDVNDSKADAKRLTRFCERFPVLVNLIPYNNVSRAPFQPTSARRIQEFQTILRSSGIDATIRYSRGRSIDAACGQLRLHQSP
jgi:23S rRNA (adenine2503-C2)-methyltransferase